MKSACPWAPSNALNLRHWYLLSVLWKVSISLLTIEYNVIMVVYSILLFNVFWWEGCSNLPLKTYIDWPVFSVPCHFPVFNRFSTSPVWLSAFSWHLMVSWKLMVWDQVWGYVQFFKLIPSRVCFIASLWYLLFDSYWPIPQTNLSKQYMNSIFLFWKIRSVIV